MKAKTVFVVGAGASREFGLPVGKELTEIIANRLNYQIIRGSLVPDSDGDPDILDAIQQFANDRPTLDSYLAAAKRIREGIIFSSSIDTFLDLHRDDVKITQLGKLAIAKTILEREKNSSLFIDYNSTEFRDVQSLKETWLVRFVRGLSDGVRREEINRLFERVSFVVFNYDRCIEHFLYQSLKKLYGLSDGEAAAAMKNLVILHPYGTISDLPWQTRGGIPFGFTANRPNLLMTASQIRTFTEQLEDNDLPELIEQEVAAAEAIVFLGFSYHPSNMRLLDFPMTYQAERVFGTAFEISESDTREIESRVRALIGKTDVSVHIRNDLKCAKILEEYSRSIFTPGQMTET
jgi:hypothetical protein